MNVNDIASQRRRASHLPNGSSRNATPGDIPESELTRATIPMISVRASFTVTLNTWRAEAA
jgi:hypothetical protein